MSLNLHVETLIIISMFIDYAEFSEITMNNKVIDFTRWTGTKQIYVRGKLMNVINFDNFRAPDGCEVIKEDPNTFEWDSN